MTINQINEVRDCKSLLDNQFSHRFIQGKIAFLRYKIDQKELKYLKKLGIDKYLDEIIQSGSLDKTSLQCLTKIRAREKRIASYPEIFRHIWNQPEVKELEAFTPEEAERKIKELRQEIRELDQIVDQSHVKRIVRKIEGKKVVTFSEDPEIHQFVPEKGNYQSLKLRVKKIESLPDPDKRVKLLKGIVKEMEESMDVDALLDEPTYKSLYLKVSGLLEPLS